MLIRKEVTITLAGKTVNATADTDGRWLAKLPKLAAGGPYTLEIKSASGNKTIKEQGDAAATKQQE